VPVARNTTQNDIKARGYSVPVGPARRQENR